MIHPVKMTRPIRYLVPMLLFLAAVVAVAGLLAGPLTSAFMANPYLNGVIAVTLLLGIMFAFRLVLILGPEATWLQSWGRDADRPMPSDASPPRLLASVAALLSAAQGRRPRLSAPSLRSLLDGVAGRLDEGREISRYFTGLLVFLGLLGTFYGLLITIGEISGTISGLSADSGDVADLFDALKAGLQGPLSGMATAFSSSLFGLAGSMILGFLDLQAGQAQNRFYGEVEDWLTATVRLSTGGGEGGSASGDAPDAFMAALSEQAADELAEIVRLLRKGQAEQQGGQTGMRAVAEAVAGLTDQIKAQRKQMDAGQEVQRDIRTLMEKLLAVQERADDARDDAVADHLRSMDVSLKALLEGQTQQSDAFADALRQEMKLLAKASLRQTSPSASPGPLDPPAGGGL